MSLREGVKKVPKTNLDVGFANWGRVNFLKVFYWYWRT